MAANMVFVQKDVVYSRHLAYAQPHKAYSPGILLHAEVFCDYFGGTFREFDMLALREDGPPPRHKTDWCQGRREMSSMDGVPQQKLRSPTDCRETAQEFIHARSAGGGYRERRWRSPLTIARLD